MQNRYVYMQDSNVYVQRNYDVHMQKNCNQGYEKNLENIKYRQRETSNMQDATN